MLGEFSVWLRGSIIKASKKYPGAGREVLIADWEKN